MAYKDWVRGFKITHAGMVSPEDLMKDFNGIFGHSPVRWEESIRWSGQERMRNWGHSPVWE
jgi:hypothetical protein